MVLGYGFGVRGQESKITPTRFLHALTIKEKRGKKRAQNPPCGARSSNGSLKQVLLLSPNQVLTHAARAAAGTSGGRARRARRALVRVTFAKPV